MTGNDLGIPEGPTYDPTEDLAKKDPVKWGKKKTPFYPSIPFTWRKEITDTLEKGGYRVNSVTLAVLWAIYREHEMVKKSSDKTFSLSHTLMEKCYFVERKAVNRVLHQLENVGVIEVVWKKNACHKITLMITGVIK